MLGIAIGLAVLMGIVVGPPAVPVALAIAAFDGVSRWRAPWFAAVVALAVIAGAVSSPTNHTGDVAAVAAGYRELAVLVEQIREGRGDARFLNVRSATGETYCTVIYGSARIGIGDRLEVRGEVFNLTDLTAARSAALRQVDCDGLLDIERFDVVAQGSGWRRELQEARETVSRRFTSTVDGDAGALLSGLVIGDDSDLSPDTLDAFYRTSMSHITAVSGSNLALLTWLVLPARNQRRWPIHLTALAGLWGYVMLAGAGPSTIRAGLTASLCVIAPWLGRRADVLTVASLVAAFQVLVRPDLIDRVAFQLSTVATIAMVASLSGVRGTDWKPRVRQIVIPVVAIQLATLPFTIGEDQAMLAAIVTNVLCAPLVALAFVCGAISAVLFVIWEPAGEALAITGSLPAELIIVIVRWIASGPLGDARLDPDEAGSRVLLGALVAAVVFGILSRQSRRGVGDALESISSAPLTLRAGWAGMAAGGLLAVAVEWLAR